MAKISVNIDERTWNYIQDTYENSDEPVRTICAQYGITQRTLYARMNAENWKRRHGQSGDKDTKAIAQLSGIVTRRVALLRLSEKKGRGVKTVALIDNISALVKLLERIEALEKKRVEATSGNRRNRALSMMRGGSRLRGGSKGSSGNLSSRPR